MHARTHTSAHTADQWKALKIIRLGVKYLYTRGTDIACYRMSEFHLCTLEHINVNNCYLPAIKICNKLYRSVTYYYYYYYKRLK